MPQTQCLNQPENDENLKQLHQSLWSTAVQLLNPGPRRPMLHYDYLVCVRGVGLSKGSSDDVQSCEKFQGESVVHYKRERGSGNYFDRLTLAWSDWLAGWWLARLARYLK